MDINIMFNYIKEQIVLGIHLRIIVNWTLASCYLYLPWIIQVVIERIGDLCGLPDCYFKFTKIVNIFTVTYAIKTF